MGEGRFVTSEAESGTETGFETRAETTELVAALESLILGQGERIVAGTDGDGGDESRSIITGANGAGSEAGEEIGCLERGERTGAGADGAGFEGSKTIRLVASLNS